MEDWTPRSLAYADFALQGEGWVRREYRAGTLDGQARVHASDWLRDIDSERSEARRREADEANAEAASVNLAAANAAWASAEAARAQVEEAREANSLASDANLLAQRASVIATISMAVSIAAIPTSAVVAFIAAHLSKG